MKFNQKMARYLTYGIIVYIVAFIAWWTILLIKTERENTYLKATIAQSSSKYQEETDLLVERFERDKRMIVLESFVFLLLLMIASYFILNILKKQERFINLKRNFLLATTHEFKTPLSTIKLNLQTLANKELNANQKELLVKNAVNEVNRLNGLTNNILLASKIDAEGFEFSNEVFSLTELIQQTAKHHFDNHNRVQYNLEDDVSIQADQSALQVVLLNLIDNALKYSQASTPVIVELVTDKNKAIIRVIDEGIGIPNKEKENVWNRFYRIEDERTRKTIGTGLGLHLVKTMSELSNGTVKIKDNQPQGSIFEIKLPLANE